MIDNTRFADFVLVSCAHAELKDKVELSIVGGYSNPDIAHFIFEEQYVEYSLCDFVYCGAACFCKKEDALAAVELMQSEYTTVEHGQREGVEYWYLD